jgi:dolichyl-phosphate beta-glucosyltransferase
MLDRCGTERGPGIFSSSTGAERSMQAPNPDGGTARGLTSLVLPAYNAAAQVERTWHEVRGFLRRAPGNWEVLFVCDGCSDGTANLLTELTRNDMARVRVLSYHPNRGKGYAVRQGLRAACGQWRVFTDIDLAYGFEDILRLAGKLRDGAEVAIASRFHPESRLLLPPRLQGYAYRRHLQSLIFSTLVRLLLPIRQRDTQAGLKGLSARASRLVLPHLRARGFEFDCELLTACACLGLDVAEVPVCVRCEDSASTTGLRTVTRMIGELWKIRRAWRPRWLAGAAPEIADCGLQIADSQTEEAPTVLACLPIRNPQAAIPNPVGGYCGR